MIHSESYSQYLVKYASSLTSLSIRAHASFWYFTFCRSPYTLSPNNTVHDDGFVDVLQGGARRDLFFASLLDEVVGRLADEALVTL